MHVMTIVAGEQQTMNFYMNHGTDWVEPIARGLYSEIALIEEQHVTHYESLLDPLDSWLKQLVFHEYNEVYLYWSMLQQEQDKRIGAIWELDRKSVVEGKSVSVRVDHGGRRVNKKKNK